MLHAARPDPETAHDLAIRFGAADLSPPSDSCTYAEALSRAADLGLSARQIDLVGRDHTIDASKLWNRTR